jgi:hypothetical protein
MTISKSPERNTFQKNSYINQCKEEGHKAFKYKLKIETSSTLDKDGFIIEHSILDEMIQSEIKKADSCENIAKQIAVNLIDLLSSENISVFKISVKVIPIGNNITAYIEYIV